MISMKYPIGRWFAYQELKPAMRLTGISDRGLLIIALLVAVLWGCILGARVIERQALLETGQQLRPARPHPVSMPVKPARQGPGSQVAALRPGRGLRGGPAEREIRLPRRPAPPPMVIALGRMAPG